MREDIQSYVHACDPFQHNEASSHSPLGHLGRFDPPTQRWESVSTDFISSLPQTSRGHYGIYLVVDRLTNMILLAATKPDCTAAAVAFLFHDHMYRNHCLPTVVVRERDTVFLCKF